jgi:CubicO group peptidase (beta-lactamase class C family)
MRPHYAASAPPSLPAAGPARNATALRLHIRSRAKLAWHRAMLAHREPWLGVGIVLDGEVVYQKDFGVQNLETGAPFAADSVFRVASVTKSLSALASRQRGAWWVTAEIQRLATCVSARERLGCARAPRA